MREYPLNLNADALKTHVLQHGGLAIEISDIKSGFEIREIIDQVLHMGNECGLTLRAEHVQCAPEFQATVEIREVK